MNSHPTIFNFDDAPCGGTSCPQPRAWLFPGTSAHVTSTTGTYTARGNHVYQGDHLVCIAVDNATAQRIARALGQEGQS